MNIVITGANGYIGSQVVTYALNSGHEVVAVDFDNTYIDNRATYINIDIFNNRNCYELFNNPDALIHLAWRNGFSHNDPCHINDLPLHYEFVKLMIDSGVKYVSVMGSMHEVGYYEGAINENTPCNPLSLYGISKNALRQSLMLYTKDKPVFFHWLRGFYIVGNEVRSNSVFGKLLKECNNGAKEFHLNSGKMKYDFIDVDELSKQIIESTIQSKYIGIINVCSGKPIALYDKITEFLKTNNLEIELKRGVFPDRPYDSPIIYGDNSIIRHILNKETYEENNE